MYILILVTTNMFLGEYSTLQNCNQAIRDIYERKMIPRPGLLSKEELVQAQQAVDFRVQYQIEYRCVKK